MSDTTIVSLKTILLSVPAEAPGHGVAFKPEVLKDHRVGGGEVTAR